jgi:acetyl esterase
MNLKPDVVKFLDALKAMGRKPPIEGTPEESRQASKARRAIVGPGVAVARVENISIPTPSGAIRARFFVPAGELRSLIVYIHGGGWVIGELDDFDAFARELATQAKAAVLLVEYRLAPEKQFPTQVEDCWAALQWAAQQAPKLLGRTLPLVVAGDSAGGNLATVCALRARDRAQDRTTPRIDLQVLVYPVTDADFDTPSYNTYEDGPFLTRETMKWFWNHYLPDAKARQNPEASPLRAPSLAGLPPALVLYAEYDPLRSEVEAYAEAMKRAGVTVTMRRFDGTIHSFFTMFRILDDSISGIAAVANEIKKRFGGKSAAAD